MEHDGVASGYPTPTGFRRLTGLLLTDHVMHTNL